MYHVVSVDRCEDCHSRIHRTWSFCRCELFYTSFELQLRAARFVCLCPLD